MAYNVPNDALLEIQIISRLHNQICRNVFHYYYHGALSIADGGSYANAVLASFALSVGEAFCEMTSSELVVEKYRAQWIAPVRYAPVEIDPPNIGQAAGQIEETSLPTTTAQVVSTKCQRAGKKFRGRHYFPGVPLSSMDESILTNDAMAMLQATGDTIFANLTSGGQAVNPTVAHDLNVDRALQTIVATEARRVLRVQRRREVGVGE